MRCSVPLRCSSRCRSSSTVIFIGSLCALPLVRLPLTPATAARSAPSRAGRVSIILVAACAIAGIGAFLEDVGSTWGGVYVVAETGATLAQAAIPFVALMGALTVGRFASDALVDRIGPVGTLRVGAVAAFVGLLTVALAPQTWVVALGLGILGLGIAPMIPLAMDAADRAPGLSTGAGLAAAATVMRVGLFVSPLLVGALAEWVGLRIAIAICVAVPVIALILARWIRNSEPLNPTSPPAPAR